MSNLSPSFGPYFRVGVIGGGQLARMMTPQAINLGIDIRVLAEAENSSAKLAATVVGDFRDPVTVQQFAQDVDVITFDHEHVPQNILKSLTDSGISVQPPAGALRLAQNKITMRQELEKLGLPMPAWSVVHDAEELTEFLATRGNRCVVKTPVGGYDGKGVRVIEDASEVADWFEAAAGKPLLAEEAVDFKRELAQLSVRSVTGEFRAWALCETVQKDGVCAEVFAPAPGSSKKQQQLAYEIAKTVAENINDGQGVTGVLAVELFERADGELLINELAMRPHNSGHWTMDGAITSQFEQHLRAVLGLPLGSTDMLDKHSVMINILGGPENGESLADRLSFATADDEAKVHLYGKDPRPGRKVGHVNMSGNNLKKLQERARHAAAVFD